MTFRSGIRTSQGYVSRNCLPKLFDQIFNLSALPLLWSFPKMKIAWKVIGSDSGVKSVLSKTLKSSRIPNFHTSIAILPKFLKFLKVLAFTKEEKIRVVYWKLSRNLMMILKNQRWFNDYFDGICFYIPSLRPYNLLQNENRSFKSVANLENSMFPGCNLFYTMPPELNWAWLQWNMPMSKQRGMSSWGCRV